MASWQSTIETGLDVSLYDYATLVIFLAFVVIVGFARDVRIGLISAFVMQGLLYIIMYVNADNWNIPYEPMTRALLALVAYMIFLALSIFVAYKRGESYIV